MFVVWPRQEEINKAIQSVLATLPNVEQLKPEQEERLRHFIIITGKDVETSLLMGLCTAHIISGKLRRAGHISSITAKH